MDESIFRKTSFYFAIAVLITMLICINSSAVVKKIKSKDPSKELKITNMFPGQNSNYKANDEGEVKLRITFNKDIELTKIKDLYKENFFYIDRYGKKSVDSKFIRYKYNKELKTLEYSIKYCRAMGHT